MNVQKNAIPWIMPLGVGSAPGGVPLKIPARIRARPLMEEQDRRPHPPASFEVPIQPNRKSDGRRAQDVEVGGLHPPERPPGEGANRLGHHVEVGI